MARYRLHWEIAGQVVKWLEEGRGIQVWRGLNMSAPQPELLTPARTPDGKETAAPLGGYEKDGPARTRFEDFEVDKPREVERFRVRTRLGSNNPTLIKLKDSSMRNRDKKLARWQGWSCKCGWKGFEKDLKLCTPAQAKKAGLHITRFDTCPACKQGDSLIPGERAFWLPNVFDSEIVIFVPEGVEPLEVAYKAEADRRHTVQTGTLHPDGTLTDCKRITPEKCPHLIMLPEHFRADGSCLCDDPKHREMMIKEWGYSEEGFANIPLRKGD